METNFMLASWPDKYVFYLGVLHNFYKSDSFSKREKSILGIPKKT